MRRMFNVFALATLLAATGCARSGSDYTTAPVSGTVYLDGRPAADMDVYFVSGTYVSYAKTDAQGEYELVSGAAVGENKIYFSKMSEPKQGMRFPGGMDAGQLFALRDPGLNSSQLPKQLIPEEYSDPMKTQVRLVVPESGTSTADFKIRSR